MIRLAVSRQERRTLALGALAIGSLVLLGPGRRAERDWELRVQMSSESTRAHLQRSMELLNASGMVRDSLAARRQRFRSLSPSLLTADTRAAAGPALAGLVSRLSAAASLTVSALEVQVDSAPTRSLAVATVHLSGIGDISGVAALLSHLEANPARIAIRALSVTQAEPSAPKTRMETLRVDVTVTALVATWHSEFAK